MRRFGLTPRILAGVLMIVVILFSSCLQAAPISPLAARMRPYTGIGVVILTIALGENGMAPTQLQLYDDPAIYRLGELEIATIPRDEWIFGLDTESVPLIVMARKGEWLRVVYDAAGREAWINPRSRGTFYLWETFFKDQSGHLLSGLKKRYYQIFSEPGIGPLVSLPPRLPFTVTTLDGDWIHLIIPDQKVKGWLRWRDEDGRLLIGLEREGSLPRQQQ